MRKIVYLVREKSSIAIQWILRGTNYIFRLQRWLQLLLRAINNIMPQIPMQV